MDSADALFSLGALTASVVGLAVMSSAYSGIFTRAETIGAASGGASRAASAAGAAGATSAADRAGSAVLSVYSLRFLPVDTVSLARYMDDAASSSGPDRNADGVAVFAARGGDSGALALSARLRAADVGRGVVDAFPVPCCVPGDTKPWAESAEGMDTVVSAEPPGRGLRAWRAARDLQATERPAGVDGAPPVIVVRFSGTRARGFVQSLISSSRTSDEGDPALAAAVSCAASISTGGGADGDRKSEWACSARCPCSSEAWVPAVIFAASSP